uniref:(northern house mosquito) hypothetical protein n=1 Tax=Culex pipiens TaxID=7175 RepID=A0A8D8MTM2_CULPI
MLESSQPRRVTNRGSNSTFRKFQQTIFAKTIQLVVNKKQSHQVRRTLQHRHQLNSFNFTQSHQHQALQSLISTKHLHKLVHHRKRTIPKVDHHVTVPSIASAQHGSHPA